MLQRNLGFVFFFSKKTKGVRIFVEIKIMPQMLLKSTCTENRVLHIDSWLEVRLINCDLKTHSHC